MCSFYYEFKRISPGFNYILTKIISLGKWSFLIFKMVDSKGGVLKGGGIYSGL